MKALVLTGLKQLEVQDYDKSEVKPNEVLISHRLGWYLRY